MQLLIFKIFFIKLFSHLYPFCSTDYLFTDIITKFGPAVTETNVKVLFVSYSAKCHLASINIGAKCLSKTASVDKLQ